MFSNNILTNNIIALIITFAAALIWLRINNLTANRGWIQSDLSRKIIHIGTGPIFVLCWLLFKEAPSARYLAALVPFTITIQFILVGLGLMKDESAVQSMSRTGDPRELLRGPLLYGLVFAVLTILYWKDSSIGVIALMLVCGGDGLADILGRRFGKSHLPWNTKKSWVGSFGMFAGGWVLAYSIILIYICAGTFSGPGTSFLPAITLIALAATLVESLPIKDIDNLTIALASVFVGHLLI